MAGPETRTIPIRPALYERLSALAAREGKRIEEVADELLTETLTKRGDESPGFSSSRSFSEILAPVHRFSREQGETDEEIGEFVDAEIRAYRAERREREAAEVPESDEPLLILQPPRDDRA